MALSAKIFKVELIVSDVDQAYYQTHHMTVARHPSENDKRMMLRLLAFALHASERLTLTKGLSTDDEPDLWCQSLSGVIELWVELGQPEPKRLKKVCPRSEQAIVYSYGENATQAWWKKSKELLSTIKNLQVFSIADDSVDALAALVKRSMSLQCTVSDGDIWFASDEQSVEVKRSKLL